MKYLFEENQKFTQWWLWILLFFVSLSLFLPFRNSYNLLIACVIPTLFYFLELRIKVTEEGLHYRFFPFHFKIFVNPESICGLFVVPVDYIFIHIILCIKKFKYK